MLSLFLIRITHLFTWKKIYEINHFFNELPSYCSDEMEQLGIDVSPWKA